MWWKLVCLSPTNYTLPCLSETDDKMRAFAEKVFASETKDENIRDEISMFDVAEDCPILHHEMAHHLHTEDDTEKRWEGRLCTMTMSLYVAYDEKQAILSSDSGWSQTWTLTFPFPKQEAPALQHHGRAQGCCPGSCCPCSVSGSGHTHTPGSSRLPESGHRWRLRCWGTIYFPSILISSKVFKWLA